MSKWTHLICEDCWTAKNPDGRKAAHLTPLPFEEAKACCFCGKPTWAEIYVRTDGAELHCQGRCDN